MPKPEWSAPCARGIDGGNACRAITTAYDVASQQDELSRAFARQNDLDLSHALVSKNLLPVIVLLNMTLRQKAVANELSTTLQSVVDNVTSLVRCAITA